MHFLYHGQGSGSVCIYKKHLVSKAISWFSNVRYMVKVYVLKRKCPLPKCFNCVYSKSFMAVVCVSQPSVVLTNVVDVLLICWNPFQCDYPPRDIT